MTWDSIDPDTASRIGLIRAATVVPKAATGPGVAMFNWGTPIGLFSKSPQKAMKEAQQLYHSNPWVRAAESTVTRRVVGLPWHLEDENDEEQEGEPTGPLKVATDLLEKPQANVTVGRKMTRRGLWSLTSRHLGLCGMAYWYLDQRDALAGIPLSILYVNPARVWTAEDDAGNLTGWVLDPKDDAGRGGIPLGLDELIPFYLDEPDHGNLATGLVEVAALKAQITTLADRHAAYILATGGRLAGIVSPKEGSIPDDKFQALVREFRNLVEAPDAAKRTTILQGPVDFTPTAANPSELNLLDLSKMNRDDIFGIWGFSSGMAGIPSPAGLNSGDRPKWDEQILMQGPVHDRVVALREPIQCQLLDRWQKIGTTIDLEIEEPEFEDAAPAYEIAAKARELPLTNKERRELVGLDPFGNPEIDEAVWLPVGLTEAYPGGPDGPQGAPESPPAAPPAVSIAPSPEGNTTDDVLTGQLLDAMGKGAQPAFIFGRKNPAYQRNASAEVVTTEMAAIASRAKKHGKKPTASAIRATFRRNFERRMKRLIAERATKKRGTAPNDKSINATFEKFFRAALDKITGQQSMTKKADDLDILPFTDAELDEMIGEEDDEEEFVDLEAAKSRIGDAMAAAHSRYVKRAQATLQKTLAAILAEQRDEIAARVERNAAHLASRPKDTASWWDGAKWEKRLMDALTPHYARTYDEVGKRVEALFAGKAEPAFVYEPPSRLDPTLTRILQRTADRVKRINETTRDAIREAIGEGLDLGEGAAELGSRVAEAAVFDPYRGELIARTETMFAWNSSAIESYRDVGVEMVEPQDGDQDEECAARMARGAVTLEEALDDEDHPNGTLAWSPVVDLAQLRADVRAAGLGA